MTTLNLTQKMILPDWDKDPIIDPNQNFVAKELDMNTMIESNDAANCPIKEFAIGDISNNSR